MTQKDINLSTDWGLALLIYANTSSDRHNLLVMSEHTYKFRYYESVESANN